MTSRLIALSPVFSAAFGVIYVVCMHFNISPFAYYPRSGEFYRAVTDAVEGPPMFFYGWLTYALVGAVVVTLLATVLPRRLSESVWPICSWVIPIGAIIVSAYFMRIWFIN